MTATVNEAPHPIVATGGILFDEGADLPSSSTCLAFKLLPLSLERAIDCKVQFFTLSSTVVKVSLRGVGVHVEGSSCGRARAVEEGNEALRFERWESAGAWKSSG